MDNRTILDAANTENTRSLIRPYQDSDELQVIGVWYRSGKAGFTYLPGWQSMTPDLAEWIFRTIILPKNSLWVGTLEERIIAYMAMHGSFIDRLFVDPPEWRKGWGTRLINLAKQISPSGLELFTHQENLAARALYERQGLKAVKFGISPPPESAPDVEYHWRP